MGPEISEFLTKLATDPDRMNGYINDPEGEMAAANLPESDRQILRNNEFSKLGPMMMVFIRNVTGAVTPPNQS